MAQAKKGMSGKAKVAIGAGLAAAATAAYFLTGERGKKNRAKIQAMSKTMQAKVKQELAKFKKVGAKEYAAVIEKVSKLKK